MTTRIQKTDASDLTLAGGTATRVQSAGAGVDTSFNSAPANGGGQETHFFVTNAGIPNNDAWEDGGTWTVEVEIDSGNASFTCDVRVGRCDSAGNILQVGSFIGTQAMDVTRTFSPVAPTWTNGEEACGNRQFVELLITNNNAHGANSIDIGVGTAANEIIDDLSVDTAGCAAAATPFYYTVYRRLQQGMSIILDTLEREILTSLQRKELWHSTFS